MLNKVLIGVILVLCVALGSQYLILESRSKSLVISQQEVTSLTLSLKRASEEAEKAQSLRKKHEEIIAELFQDQDTTQEQFDDLASKFSRLKGTACRPQSVQQGALANVKEDVVVKLDLSEHKRLLSEAACLAGKGSACSTSTTPPK